MARPTKRGIDYFPLDVDIEQDDKILLICGELGELAFGRIIKLWLEIYRDGYFKIWNEKAELLFSSKKNIPLEEVRALIKATFRHGFLEENLYKKHGILTSSGIQKRYITACRARQKILIYKKLLLCDVDEFSETIKSKLKLVDLKLNNIDLNKTSIIDESIPKLNKSKLKKDYSNNRFEENSKNKEYHPLAQRLLELHLEIDPAFMGKKASNGFIEKSADAFRLLVERDGRNRKEVETILEWCKRDDFWSSVIQSGGGFRRNYGQMKTQWQRRVKKEEAEMQKEGFTLEEDIDL